MATERERRPGAERYNRASECIDEPAGLYGACPQGGNMLCKSVLWMCMILFPAFTIMAQEATDADKQSTAKELSGMSIVGNDEAPKSLYIVPWKNSEIGVDISLNAMLNEGDMPVDRDVFKRQLDFYHVRTAKQCLSANAGE
jgi:hypothetical protein